MGAAVWNTLASIASWLDVSSFHALSFVLCTCLCSHYSFHLYILARSYSNVSACWFWAALIVPFVASNQKTIDTAIPIYNNYKTTQRQKEATSL
jgi:hypothetical protein